MDENKDELEIVEEVKIQRKDQDRGGFAWGMSRFLYSNSWFNIMAGMER